MWIFLFTIVFDCHRASIFFPIWIKQFAILAEEPALVNWKTVSPLSGDAKTADEYGLEYETVTFIFPQPLHFPLFKQFFIPRTVFFFFFFFLRINRGAFFSHRTISLFFSFLRRGSLFHNYFFDREYLVPRHDWIKFQLHRICY